MVLTPSGGHRNTYGWQAGGTHPTEMLSCFIITARKQSLRRLCFHRCLSVHRGGGRAWQWGCACCTHTPCHACPPPRTPPCHARPLRHAVNDRAVRILLEMHSCLIK